MYFLEINFHFEKLFYAFIINIIFKFKNFNLIIESYGFI